MASTRHLAAWASVTEARRYLSGRLLETLQLLVMAVVGQAGSSLLAIAALLPGALVGLIVFAVTQSLVPRWWWVGSSRFR